jgi:hypothetical protein
VNGPVSSAPSAVTRTFPGPIEGRDSTAERIAAGSQAIRSAPLTAEPTRTVPAQPAGPSWGLSASVIHWPTRVNRGSRSSMKSVVFAAMSWNRIASATRY